MAKACVVEQALQRGALFTAWIRQVLVLLVLKRGVWVKDPRDAGRRSVKEDRGLARLLLILAGRPAAAAPPPVGCRGRRHGAARGCCCGEGRPWLAAGSGGRAQWRADGAGARKRRGYTMVQALGRALQESPARQRETCSPSRAARAGLQGLAARRAGQGPAPAAAHLRSRTCSARLALGLATQSTTYRGPATSTPAAASSRSPLSRPAPPLATMARSQSGQEAEASRVAPPALSTLLRAGARVWGVEGCPARGDEMWWASRQNAWWRRCAVAGAAAARATVLMARSQGVESEAAGGLEVGRPAHERSVLLAPAAAPPRSAARTANPPTKPAHSARKGSFSAEQRAHAMSARLKGASSVVATWQRRPSKARAPVATRRRRQCGAAPPSSSCCSWVSSYGPCKRWCVRGSAGQAEEAREGKQEVKEGCCDGKCSPSAPEAAQAGEDRVRLHAGHAEPACRPLHAAPPARGARAAAPRTKWRPARPLARAAPASLLPPARHKQHVAGPGPPHQQPPTPTSSTSCPAATEASTQSALTSQPPAAIAARHFWLRRGAEATTWVIPGLQWWLSLLPVRHSTCTGPRA